MTKITFKKVSKLYKGSNKPAVDNVNFSVPDGSICMLIGPSGSGKTTLLRMVNRLIEPSAGKILINGQDVLQENPIFLRRHIGYVIQQIGLFPHMNVAENIKIAAEVSGNWKKQNLNAHVNDLLELVGLSSGDYCSRFPQQLSGGQQQRVGLARALAADPSVLLMDEPFGALDVITRTRMQDELLRIQRTMHKTILFVSHDIEEAFRLGDQIAILFDGKLKQLGTPVELLLRPVNTLVRKLIGADNILRKLQYLPASILLNQETQKVTIREGNSLECSSTITLLEAMMKLLDANISSLSLYDKRTQKYLGYITRTSINRIITRS